MFLPCQITRLEQDYEIHRDNMFYKKVVTTLNKRITRAAKRHKYQAIVYVGDLHDNQLDVLNIICEEYINAGYKAEVRTIENSADKYIQISW